MPPVLMLVAKSSKFIQLEAWSLERMVLCKMSEEDSADVTYNHVNVNDPANTKCFLRR